MAIIRGFDFKRFGCNEQAVRDLVTAMGHFIAAPAQEPEGVLVAAGDRAKHSTYGQVYIAPGRGESVYYFRASRGLAMDNVPAGEIVIDGGASLRYSKLSVNGAKVLGYKE